MLAMLMYAIIFLRCNNLVGLTSAYQNKENQYNMSGGWISMKCKFDEMGIPWNV
jgi:hypothetical protein